MLLRKSSFEPVSYYLTPVPRFSSVSLDPSAGLEKFRQRPVNRNHHLTYSMSQAVFSIVLCYSLGFNLAEALTLPNFYPFGANEGDKVVPKNDDGSSGPVQISIAFPFFDENHRSLYVSITTFSTVSNLCLLSKTETRNLIYTFYTVIICLSESIILRYLSSINEFLLKLRPILNALKEKQRVRALGNEFHKVVAPHENEYCVREVLHLAKKVYFRSFCLLSFK